MKQKQKNKPITLKRKVYTKQLQSEIKKTTDEKYKTHLRAVLLFYEGKTKQEITSILVVSRDSVRSWIALYNKEGQAGLKTKPTGRPKGKKKWDDDIFQGMAKEVDKSEKYWSVRLMTEWLRENKHVIIPKQTIWYRMTQIGYSHKSSRPYPYQGDEKKQEKFKKKAL